MPAVPHPLTVPELNDAWRNGFGRTLTGADKRDLAPYEGVSERTIQRWTTQAEQQRNPFPSRLNNLPRDEWPEVYQARAATTERLQNGGQAEEQTNASPAEFGQVRGTLSSADEWAEALEADLIDPWLTAAWREYRIVRTERGWEVRVVYDATVSPEAAAAA